MFRYIVRRILVAIPLLFASSILTFVLVTNIGTPKKIEDAIARPNASQQQIDSLRRQFGLDKGPVERYTTWFKNFLTGDWGTTASGSDIRHDIGEAAKVTLTLLVVASVVSVILGVLVGVTSALRQYTLFDYVMTFFAFLFFSIPAAVLAGVLKEYGAIKLNPWLREPSMSTGVMIAIALFGLVAGFLVMRNRYKYERERPPRKYVQGAMAGLGVAVGVILAFQLIWGGNVYRVGNPKPLIATVGSMTPGYVGSLWETTQDKFWHMLLPSMALILIGFAGYSRYMRASMLDVMTSDYVRTARAKGIKEGRVTVRHGVRNALIPLVTIVALDFGALLSGAIITETIYGWSGMGRFFVEALTEKDPPALLAFVMVTAISVIVFNLIADIIYAQLDPRIRL